MLFNELNLRVCAGVSFPFIFASAGIRANINVLVWLNSRIVIFFETNVNKCQSNYRLQS